MHGVVQGVGYRHLVSRAAGRNGIRGGVRNAEDGSVEIFAEAAAERLQAFLKEIDVSSAYGPQVFSIERHAEGEEGFRGAGFGRNEGFVILG